MFQFAFQNLQYYFHSWFSIKMIFPTFFLLQFILEIGPEKLRPNSTWGLHLNKIEFPFTDNKDTLLQIQLHFHTLVL